MAEQQNRPPWFGFLIFLLAAGLILYISMGNRVPPLKQLAYSEFLTQVLNGKVDAVRVTNSQLIGVLKATDESGAKDSISTPRLPSMDESWLMQELRERQIQIIAEPQTDKWWTGLLGWLFPIMMILFFYSWAARARMGQSGFSSVGKSRAKIYDEYRQSEVTFADVAGVDEAEAELIEVVDFLKNPQKYTKLGGRIPKGVLLVGPPGTGKSHHHGSNEYPGSSRPGALAGWTVRSADCCRPAGHRWP